MAWCLTPKGQGLLELPHQGRGGLESALR
jgi:hypothetical protein